MTSIRVKYRPSTAAGREGTVYYQIIHNRTVRRFMSSHTLRDDEWDKRNECVAGGSPGDIAHTTRLRAVRFSISRDLDRLRRIIRKLDTVSMVYTADDVVDEYRRHLREYTLFNFMESVIATLFKNGKLRTSEIYRATLNSFMKFRNGEDIMLDCLTPDVTQDYQQWLLARGLSLNTVSFYMRVIRAVYNRAAEEEAIDGCNPFRHVYTGIGKTVKRALPVQSIRRIKLLDLRTAPALDYARDMFMLSFYLRGMSFIDMAYLRKSNLTDGRLSYCRRKTGQRLCIEWTDEMQSILDKYPANTSEYLLPIIRSHVQNDRCVYRNMSYTINRNLKKVARSAGIRMSLTPYVARHSWASAAQANGIPLNVIREGMGHESETTTRIYLASLDTSAVDRANSIIIKALKSK